MLEYAGVEDTHLPLHLHFLPAPDIPPWWVSLGPVPNPPQSSGVAQHVGCLRILASHPSPLKEV